MSGPISRRRQALTLVLKRHGRLAAWIYGFFAGRSLYRIIQPNHEPGRRGARYPIMLQGKRIACRGSHYNTAGGAPAQRNVLSLPNPKFPLALCGEIRQNLGRDPNKYSPLKATVLSISLGDFTSRAIPRKQDEIKRTKQTQRRCPMQSCRRHTRRQIWDSSRH